MAGYIYSSAPPHFIQKLQEIENQSDGWFRELEICHLPGNLATWAVLTKLIEKIEEQIRNFGPYDPNFDFAMIEFSRSASVLIEEIQKRSGIRFVPRSRFRWRPALATTADVALKAAQ